MKVRILKTKKMVQILKPTNKNEVRVLNTTIMNVKGERVEHLAKGDRRNLRKASLTLDSRGSQIS